MNDERMKVMLLMQHWDTEAANLFGPLTKTFLRLKKRCDFHVIARHTNIETVTQHSEVAVTKIDFSRFRPLYFWRFLRACEKKIKAERIDIVYAQSLGYFALVIILLKLRFGSKVRIVFWLCGDGSQHSKEIDGFLSVNKTIFIMLHAWVNRMISCCEVLAVDQSKYYLSKRKNLYRWFPNSFDNQTYYPNGNKRFDGPLTITYVSRKSSRKGYDRFCSIVQKMHNHKNIHFQSIGGGEDFKKLEESTALINKNFKIVPETNQADVANRLRKTHIFCVPARYNGFARAYVEALASGLPVLTSDTQCTQTFIRDGYNGYLCGTEENFIIKIEELLLDRTLLQTLSRNALESSKKYLIAMSAVSFLKVFEEVLQE
jgi:glycosyltransferase involved in cell wall biosynthesis